MTAVLSSAVGLVQADDGTDVLRSSCTATVTASCIIDCNDQADGDFIRIIVKGAAGGYGGADCGNAHPACSIAIHSCTKTATNTQPGSHSGPCWVVEPGLTNECTVS